MLRMEFIILPSPSFFSPFPSLPLEKNRIEFDDRIHLKDVMSGEGTGGGVVKPGFH